MPFSECVDCEVAFKWSERNHTRNRKPHRCPECREQHREDMFMDMAEGEDSS